MNIWWWTKGIFTHIFIVKTMVGTIGNLIKEVEFTTTTNLRVEYSKLFHF